MQTKTRDEKECCRVLAAGVGVKAADLTADPIDGYSFRNSTNCVLFPSAVSLKFFFCQLSNLSFEVLLIHLV